MEENPSQLEQIFNTACQKHGLLVKPEGSKKTAQGPLYFLQLEQDEKITRLIYADRVAAADLYDCQDQKYLSYSVLSLYLQSQTSFLQTLDFDLARTLLENITPTEIEVHRNVSRIDLDDLSEVDKLIDAHIENY